MRRRLPLRYGFLSLLELLLRSLLQVALHLYLGNDMRHVCQVERRVLIIYLLDFLRFVDIGCDVALLLLGGQINDLPVLQQFRLQFSLY